MIDVNTLIGEIKSFWEGLNFDIQALNESLDSD